MKKMRIMCESGFTLVELLVVLLMLALIVLAVPAAFKGSTQVWDKGDRHAEVLQNALIGMEQMSRELRQAQSISFAGADHIKFIARDDSEMAFQQGIDLESGPVGSLSPLAGPVSNLSFTYYKEDGITETASLDEIRSVLIQLDTSDSQMKTSDIPLSSKVYFGIPDNGGDEFAIFGQLGVKFRSNVPVIGNVGSNGDVILKNGVTIDGTISHLGDLVDDKGVHDGKPEYVAYYELPCPTIFTAGGPPVSSKPSDTDIPDDGLPLSPGKYGVLDLKGTGQTLHLASGQYFFKSFKAGNIFTLDIELSSGDIEIFIEGQVNIGNTFTVVLSGGGLEPARQVYFQTDYPGPGPAWEMKQNTTFNGTIYAPYGDIAMADIELRGSIHSGGWVTIFNDSSGPDPNLIIYVPSNYFVGLGYDCY